MAEKVVKIFWFVLLFVLGSVGVMFILPSFWVRFGFLIAALLVLSWTARAGHRADVNSLSLITAYVLSVAQFGLHFYFRLPAWLLMATTFIWVWLIFWLSFKLRLGVVSSSSRILSLSAAVVAAEVVMALLFWPTHFLVTSTVFFLLFYLAWITANFYMNGLLNRHRMIIHLAFVAVLLLVVVATAKWTI